MNRTPKCLVMGFYDRKNIGDDTYKQVIPQLLPSCDVVCVSCDDAEPITNDDYDIVLIGGGDLVNDYFMQRVQQVLKTYAGRVYGISLGIPFPSSCHYTHIFDHVLVRSMNDYTLAEKEIGSVNVSYLPDFSVALCDSMVSIDSNLKSSKNMLNVGVCLAQPLFYNNPKRSILIESVCQALLDFTKTSSLNPVRIILLAFNSNTRNTQECDYIINDQVSKRLKNLNVNVVIRHDISTPTDMLNFFVTDLDMCLCMRYHSVMFALIAGIPFVPLYVSQKIHNLLQDISYPDDIACRLPIDAKYRPTSIDKMQLVESMRAMQGMQHSKPYRTFDTFDIKQKIFNKINEVVMDRQPYATHISRIKAITFTDVLGRCKMALCKYLDIEPHNFGNILHRVGALTHDIKTPLDIARFICFNITGQMHHPCVWGLAENLQKSSFKLYDAVKYIYDEVSTTNSKRGLVYYPTITNFHRQIFINIDFIFSNDFTKYHRSGWSYVVGGLMNLDASTMLRQSDVFIDTYVDRTFHWGRDIMKTLGEIPYTKPWYGFIHHTFDTTHSGNNCHVLFEQDDFLASLETCKGIIVLTKYLQKQIENSLHEKGFEDIPVHTLYHPMEFVDNEFTMSKFVSNQDKKVVQIGAWLRNPYAIYRMKMPSSSEMHIKKAHLKGTEMDLYFAPANFLESITDAMCANESIHIPSNMTICRSENMCRENSPYPTNKYCQGALELLTENHNSVSVLDKLSNSDYDNLLAENIVFLNLVDCSAVNTVIECIVRNTPLIVNRHPALEDVLGSEYPGFYTSLDEAASICGSLYTIERIHNHMKMLDKQRYMLENFIRDFQEIIVLGTCSSTYLVHQPILPQNLILPFRHFQKFYKFLPPRFQLADYFLA